MHKNINFILAFIVILLVSCKEKPVESGSHSSVSAQQSITSVEVINPTINNFGADVIITGSVVPDKMASIYSMENGYLKSVKVDIGDKVKSGQVIAIIDNPEIRYAVENSKAKIEEVNAELKVMSAKIKAAKSENILKQNKYKRLKNLFDNSEGLTTLTELENAQNDQEQSTAKIDLLMAQNISKTAVKKSFEVALKLNKERMSYLTIRAPFSGLITKRYLDAGVLLQSALDNSNSTPIVKIEILDKVRVVIPLPESDVSGLKVGSKATINFPYLKGESFEATISRMSNSLDADSKTMEVQIDLSNKDLKIQPGMYAKVNLNRQSRNDILSLPHTAVFMKKDAPYIFVVKNDIVSELLLKKGISGIDYFEVLNPEVNKNSMIILKGKNLVKQGQKVKAVKK